VNQVPQRGCGASVLGETKPNGTQSWATCCRWPCLSRASDQMISKGPCQPQFFHDSMKLYIYSTTTCSKSNECITYNIWWNTMYSSSSLASQTPSIQLCRHTSKTQRDVQTKVQRRSLAHSTCRRDALMSASPLACAKKGPDNFFNLIPVRSSPFFPRCPQVGKFLPEESTVAIYFGSQSSARVWYFSTGNSSLVPSFKHA